jgi:hypothetical protein
VVQPALAEPSWVKNEATISTSEATKVQNDSMFSRGKAMSRAPIISGMQKFPKAPIITGVMAKKIITRPCMVNTAV